MIRHQEKTGEVFFRASHDNGATFSDKINLSNTTGVDSINAEIDRHSWRYGVCY